MGAWAAILTTIEAACLGAADLVNFVTLEGINLVALNGVDIELLRCLLTLWCTEALLCSVLGRARRTVSNHLRGTECHLLRCGVRYRLRCTVSCLLRCTESCLLRCTETFSMSSETFNMFLYMLESIACFLLEDKLCLMNHVIEV